MRELRNSNTVKKMMNLNLIWATTSMARADKT